MNDMSPLQNDFASHTQTQALQDDAAAFSRGHISTSELRQHIRTLFASLNQYGIEEVHEPESDAKIRRAFRRFLKDCRFYTAAAAFERLLAFKSGIQERRDDGTFSWHHEFIPILYILKLIQMGKPDGGLNIRDLINHGGIEVAICTQLHHDTVEDRGVSFSQLLAGIGADAVQYCTHQNLPFDIKFIANQAEMTRQNVQLMTKKIAKFNDDGTPVLKEDGSLFKISLFPTTTAYTHNMLTHPAASPIAYMGKLGDSSHNLIFIGSPKFTPERKIKYCNEREDMYGARYGFTDIAMEKWPEFASAVKKLDDVMGTQLYLNFRYLECVDMAYPDKYREGDPIYPVGIGRYLKGALSLNIPPAFSVVHINLHRMMKEAQTNPRTAAFLMEGVRPALAGYEKHFSGLLDPSRSSTLPQTQAYGPNPV